MYIKCQFHITSIFLSFILLIHLLTPKGMKKKKSWMDISTMTKFL